MAERVGISLKTLETILRQGELEVNEDCLFAGAIKREYECVIIGIPLWFDIVSAYVVCTNKKLMICVGRFWTGIQTMNSVPYGEVHSMVFKKSVWFGCGLTVRLHDGRAFAFKPARAKTLRGLHAVIAPYASVVGE
jgi:hypothetical protein